MLGKRLQRGRGTYARQPGELSAERHGQACTLECDEGHTIVGELPP
jgi:hypothetical protein